MIVVSPVVSLWRSLKKWVELGTRTSGQDITTMLFYHDFSGDCNASSLSETPLNLNMVIWRRLVDIELLQRRELLSALAGATRFSAFG